MMTRSSFRPMASLGLVAAVLVYVGCSKTPETADRPIASIPNPVVEVQAPRKKGEPPKTAKVPKVIADWSAKPPVAVLIISGEQDGYPDPCGCTDGQLGGLGRRYHFCQMLEAKGWPVVKIDLGNLIHYRGAEWLAQEKIKFSVIHTALSAMKYDAVALGPEDLKLGVIETLAALLNFKEPRFLAANVKAIDKDLGEALRSTRLTNAGGLTFGITAVLDPATYQTIQDDAAGTLNVLPPDEVLPEVYANLRRQAMVTILMVQGPHDEAKRLATKFPGFDIVIGTSKFDDPDEKPETLNNGRTLLINNIGKRGKYAGVVGFFPDAEQRMVFRRQPLDGVFEQAAPMKVLIDKEYQDMLKGQGVVENFQRSPNGQAPGASYVGAQACQACHPKTFEKWTTTKHARAYEPLTNPRRNREFDAECISCHTTGFGYNTGWVSAEKTPLLKGNQCENCHGPASLHAAEPDNIDRRKSLKMSAESAKSNAFCTKCHDSDNDPHFTFDSRYNQIFHKGLDSYDDPKVHQPQPAKVAEGPK
jgi:Cytochrome c554 and c-prime